jgi:RimJ/RimL family protein N-acetyltransferase
MVGGDRQDVGDGSVRQSSVRFRTMRTLLHGLDPADEEMCQFVSDMLNDPHVFQTYSDEGREPLTRADVRGMFEGDDAYAFVACERGSGEMIGVVEVSRLDRRTGNALVGNIVKPEYQGQKYGMEIPLPVVDWLFETVRCHRVWSIAGANADPDGMAEFDAFEREGILREADYIDGEYVDRHIIASLEEEWRAAKAKHVDMIAQFKPTDAVYPRLPDEATGTDAEGDTETVEAKPDAESIEPSE